MNSSNKLTDSQSNILSFMNNVENNSNVIIFYFNYLYITLNLNIENNYR